MKKLTFSINYFVIIFIVLAGLAIFLINSYQVKTMAEVSAIFKSEPQKTPNPIPSVSDQNKSSEEQQIAQLRQEIEDLKKRQTAQEKSALKPVASPTVDLKTQQELDNARAQINSLTQQLVQIQKDKAQSTASSLSDANLLKSWQASDKVVQVACQDKLLNSWQMGSGVIISVDGKVLTNQHVVQSSLSLAQPDYCLILFSKDYNAQTQTYNKQYRATIAGFFQDHDAALLKINDLVYADSSGMIQSTPVSGGFSYFQIASAAPQIGDPVYVVGFPESAQFAFSVTKGIISNLTSDNLYYGTDAQIDRGNSGGAALNSAGQLIGLPTYKFVSAGDYRGYILNIQTIKL